MWKEIFGAGIGFSIALGIGVCIQPQMHLYHVIIELADIGFGFNIKVYRSIYFASSKMLVYDV